MADLIDRQAAIEAMAELQGRAASKSELLGISKAWKRIKALPSATDTNVGDTDTISREAAIKSIQQNYGFGSGEYKDGRDSGLLIAESIVSNLPSAQKRGEWIPKEKADTPYGLEMECAKCGFSVIVNDALYFKFCPSCGARMEGVE